MGDILTAIGSKLSDMAWVLMIGFWLLGAAILLALFATGLGTIAWQLIS